MQKKLLSLVMMIAMIFTLVTVGPVETRADEPYTGVLRFIGDGKLYEGWSEKEYTGKGVTWSASGNTLTLKGFSYESTAYYALLLEADTTIVLEEGTTNTITCSGYDPNAYDYWDSETQTLVPACYMYGITVYAQQNLTIQGTGTLNINKTGDYGGQVISARGDMTINGGTINLTACKPSRDNIYSEGIECSGKLTINGGTITSVGVGGYVSEGNSRGVWTSAFEMTGGTLNAIGGDDVQYSFGLIAYDSAVISGGTINATSGRANWSKTIEFYGSTEITGGTIVSKAGEGVGVDEKGVSCGMLFDGDTVIKNGTIVSTAGTADGYALGIWCDESVTINISGGSITAKGGTAPVANGINAIGTINISGGTVNAYGGKGTKEYYGLWAGKDVKISGKGKLNLYGNKNASAKAALYVENDTAVFKISDSAIVTADSSIKTDNTLIVSGSAVVQAKGVITAAKGITAPRATGAKETFVSGTTTTLTQAGTDSLVLGIDTVEPFTDVKIASWYADAVKYVYSRGIMNGTTKTTFAPAENITRAQLVVMLWNMEGHPNVTVSTKPYKDVAVNKYYSKAVQWAKNNKIVSGYKNGNFGTGDSITRQDATVILMNYVKYKKLNTTTNGTKYTACTDYKKVSGYAVNAIEWAYERNLIGSNGTLNPKGNITRAEAASMLQRLLLYYKI